MLSCSVWKGAKSNAEELCDVFDCIMYFTFSGYHINCGIIFFVSTQCSHFSEIFLPTNTIFFLNYHNSKKHRLTIIFYFGISYSREFIAKKRNRLHVIIYMQSRGGRKYKKKEKNLMFLSNQIVSSANFDAQQHIMSNFDDYGNL